jgi:hypothetical protein
MHFPRASSGGFLPPYIPTGLRRRVLGDEHVDYELGDTFGREAVGFVRSRYGATLLALTLNALSKRLHEERRSAHDVERGFLDGSKLAAQTSRMPWSWSTSRSARS